MFFIPLLILAILSTFTSCNISFKRENGQNSIQWIRCGKKKKKQVFTTARLFFLLVLYFFFSNSWHLVWFLTASELMFCIIITPGFFSAAVMTASESIILCNERVFTLFYLMYITLHLSTLNFISICWPLNHLHTYSMFSCQKQKFHTPSNYSFWFSPSIRYFFMKIFAKFIHLQ